MININENNEVVANRLIAYILGAYMGDEGV
jgi:hypothetical protein